MSFPSRSFWFLSFSLLCPQHPAVIFPYVWRTEVYSYIFSLSYAFWESGLGTFFLLRNKEVFKAPWDACIWTNTFVLRYLRNVYVREDGRKCYMVTDQKENIIVCEETYMSLIHEKVSRDIWYYLVRFRYMRSYRDWLSGSWFLKQVDNPHEAVCTFRNCFFTVLMTINGNSHRLLSSPLFRRYLYPE